MARAGVSIELHGFTAMKKRLTALEELDAPEITASLERISRLADGEVGRRAPGSMAAKVSTKPAKKLGATITTGTVKHPGAKAMEFGRTTYYTGYTGRNQKSGTKVQRSGQKPRPFVGIKAGDQAMSALREPIAGELTDGIQAVWNRPESD